MNEDHLLKNKVYTDNLTFVFLLYNYFKYILMENKLSYNLVGFLIKIKIKQIDQIALLHSRFQ